MSPPIVAEDVVNKEVVPDLRREEIRRYLRLFGYRPDESVLEVYLAPSLSLPERSLGHQYLQTSRPSESLERMRLVGITRDPVLGFDLVRGTIYDSAPGDGYLGCLYRPRDYLERPPDLLLPLDFTPAGLFYPSDWDHLFPPVEFHIVMEIQPKFSSLIDSLQAHLRSVSSALDARERWMFLGRFEQLARPLLTAPENTA